jgi:hypothetical protein
MKHVFILLLIVISFYASAQTNSSGMLPNTRKEQKLFIDVHHLEPAKIKFDDVAKAHAKDVAVENKYGVKFLKFWVDEKQGLVYCLSSSPDSESIVRVHREAHGLLPGEIYHVIEGDSSALKGKNDYYLDIHELGEGNVSAKDVAEAHKKDLATQKKYNVNFINYWVDEKAGVVLCLSQARDSASIVQTHKEAHGLLPVKVLKVQQGQ